MPDTIKDWWEQILAGIAVIAWLVRGEIYGRETRRIANQNAKNMHEHERDCDAAEWITVPQHDRMQSACRATWQAEFKHINETLAEIKRDIRELRGKQ